MTGAEALTAMRKVAEEDRTIGDHEGSHQDADSILVGLLRSLGHDELCDVWNQIEKWYA